MSGKDKRSPPDTGGGSQLENSTKGATSSRRRMLPNVGRSSDVEETDRKFDEAACSDNHQTSSSRADSTDSNLKGKKKGSYISEMAQTFSSEEATETQHQLKQKTHLCEKGEKKNKLPGQGKNEPKVCVPNLAEEGSKENLKIHGNKNVEGSAGKSVSGESLSKSFVVLTSDGKDEIEVNVKMLTGNSFRVSVGLNETVEALMLKIEEKKGISCENQRLIMKGNQLLKSNTLLSHDIQKDATIHLLVDTGNAADKAKVDSSSGLESNSTEVPETSDNPESKDKRDALENNPTEETDPNCSSQQDSTENGNGASQIENLEPRIRKAPSPTPTSDVGSKYLPEQEGSRMLTHPTDSQMKEKVEKSQQFMKSYKESTTKVEKLTTKVSDNGSDMNQEKGDTEIEIEGEMKIPQTPETEGEKKTPQTPETEGEKKTHQTPETEGEKDTKDDLNVLKMDKDPNDVDDENNQKSPQNFNNDLNEGEDDTFTENLKVQSLQRDHEVLDDYGSHLSESNSVETISEEDHEEEMRDVENISIPSFNMKSMTHIPGDNDTELKPHTGDEIVHGVNNSAKMPETHNAEGEEEIKHFVDGDGSVKSEEHDAIQQVTETPSFSIQKVGNGYLLYRQNYPPVILPELEEASNVSVLENVILIDNVPRYLITMKKEEITLSKLGVAKLEDNRSESSNTKRSEHGLSAETQEYKGDEEGLEKKKVRETTPDMQTVLNPPQENGPNPLSHQDTVADDNTGGSSGADVKKEEAKTGVDDITCMLKNMGIEDVPRQQQQSLKEAECKDEKPPIPAPRSKNKESKLENEQDSKSSPTPSPRTRRNSQNQPPEMKIQEQKSPTTQPIYKKVTFRVTYSLAGSPEKKVKEIEKEMGQLDYMKWKFATIDLKSLCKKLQSSAQNRNYVFQANDGILQVDIGSISENSQIENHIDNIVDIVIEYSKICIVKSVPFKHDIRGEDVKIAVQDIVVMKDGIYYVEIDEEEFCVIMICHRRIADQIVEKIKQKIRLLEASSKPHTETIKKCLVFRKKMNEESFKTLWKQRFPLVQIRDKYMQADNTLLVALSGPKTEVDRALAMIEHDYPCNEVSFRDVKYSSEFSNIVDVLCEFTGALQTVEDILVDINGEKEKIGICCTSLDTNTDTVTQSIKRCIRKKVIEKQEDCPDLTSDLVEELKEKLDEKHKPYIHLTFVNEGSIMVYGLEEHLNSCLSNLEEMVHAEGKAGSTVHKSSKEHSQSTSSCVKETIRIENPLVYECICKSEQFSVVANRGDIQVEQLNTNVQGFVINGSKEAVDSVKNEIKEIEKNIKEYTVDCEVEGNCVPNFLEHIHNFDIVVRKENIQIEPISSDSKKIQWIFAQGSTVQIAKSCSLPGKKVLVRFEEESISAKLGVKMSESGIVVSLPKWVGGSAKEKSKLSERFNECLQACLDRSSHHIDVIVGKVSWKMQTFVKQLLVADLLKELLQKRMTPCLSVCFCGSDEKICDDIYTACCGYFKGGFTSMPAEERRVTVTIINGNLADTKADILVNTIDRMGTLDRGAISKSLLRKAGKEGHKLQAEIRKFKCPLDSLKVYKTGAYLQGCKFIFHGLLEYYVVNGTSQKKLKRFVLDCLKEAESCNCSSIAFPALGAGNLDYPLYEVKAAMFDAVEEFNMSCAGGTSLQDVKFVLFEYEAFQDFKAEQNKRGSKQPCAPSCHTYGKITFKAVNGTIRDIKQDCILYLWERTAFYNAKRMPDQHVILKEIDEMDRRELFDKIFPEGSCNFETFRTIKCKNLSSKDVIHVPYKDNSSSKEKAVAMGLRLAIVLKKTSVGLYFDDKNPFLREGNFMTHVAYALSDLSSNLSQPLDVVVFVGNNFFDKAMTFFKENTQNASAVQPPKPVKPPKTENVVMTVVGTKSNLTAAVDYLRNQKEVILMELHMPHEDQVDAIPGPAFLNAQSDMERGPDLRGPTLAKKFIEPSSIFAKYVEVHNISTGPSKEQLKLELFREGKFPIKPPKLVYYVGSSKALLICQSEQDAKELSECTSLKPFIFSSVNGKALSSITRTIDKKNVEKMKEVDKYDEFKQKLESADIQIKGESPFMLVAPSTFQYCYVMSILEELTGTPSALHLPGDSKLDNEKVKSEIDEFDNIETIKDVQENVWDILCCSDQLIQIKDKFNEIAYDKDTYTVMIGPKVSKDDFKKITVIVDNLREKEWEDIPLEAKHCNKSKADRWCDEVKEVTGYECCKYIDGKGKVLVYAVNYDDRMKIKHLFSVKTGKIKTTGKGRRVGRATSDKDDRKPDTTGPSLAKSKSPDRKIDGKKKYITRENINIYVYEANILKLDVDCIVNAANESLQHGGGVAAVIEKAAGYKLTEESRIYVRVNGSLPVGKACTTTAGILSYDCVIHTVGPRWSAYFPHSMQNVQDCQLHLYQAVYNSFLEAEKRGLKSIALPAISSAIFGVPEEICVQQYALATFDYSKRTSDVPTALKEIHFIDKNSNIVKKIQDAFNLVFVKGEMPDCDPSKFVKSRRHRRGHSPGSYTGAQAGFSSSVHRDSFNASTQSATSDVYEVTQIEPLSFFENKSYAYAYLLHGKEEYKLLLSRGDLLKVKASAVVIPVDNRGYRGNIAGSLFSKIPELYREDYTFKLSSECPRKTLCDVFITQGYECGYPFILHAIYPANAKDKDISQRKHDVQKLYKNVFSLCDTKTGIQEVVAPLLGPDIRSETDIRACAEMFLQSYLDYYSRPVTKKSLLVHLVCREDLVYDCVKSVFDEYVMSKKAELNKTQEDMDISPSTPPVEKQDNVHGEENCVICMDTITEPETLKCGHTFCKDCIQQQFQFKEACPTCGQVCGVITGDQPAGEMRYAVDRYTDCSGYNGHGRIAITYNFPSGRQGPEHPSPGTFYKGITRVAYLPNNDEGRKILAMLEVAFKRKLVFTIGNSRTTGQEGVITWNDIHHKTNPRPHQQFGYPDPGYLERVKDELAVKGVTEKDIPKTISR